LEKVKGGFKDHDDYIRALERENAYLREDIKKVKFN
jgi:hypothetical protein